MKQEPNFNRLPQWLPGRILRAGFTPEQFAYKIKVSRTMVYAYLSDGARPSEQTMLRICHVLGVPFEEGLRQYTPNKVGRPRGSDTTPELSVRRS